MKILDATCRSLALATLMLAALTLATPLAAQTIQSIDPNDALIDADLAPPPATPTYEDRALDLPPEPEASPDIDSPNVEPVAVSPEPEAAVAPAQDTTYHRDDLIGAAEGVFGKGAEGVALMIEDLLRKQGEPNGYIVGREASAAIALGLRYGSGTLFHKIEGQRPVYWTGPSIGFDLGANASNTFVLVYNLHDTDDLFKRFPAGEGDAYLVGGITASYLRWGDVVLIPIRVGAGLRLGVNAGYMKFTKRQRWLPF